MKAITAVSPKFAIFGLILIEANTEQPLDRLAPEFDEDVILASAGWLDTSTRDQLAAALASKPSRPLSPFYN